MRRMGPRKTTAEVRREALTKIQASGLLGEMQLMVIKEVCHRGPMTGREINHNLDIPHAHVRLHELEEMGVVERVGTTKCSITSMTVAAWDMTGAVASPRDKSRRKVKKAPHIHEITECATCVLVDELDGEDVCWMNSSVKCLEKGRPLDCPLLVRDFIIRAG